MNQEKMMQVLLRPVVSEKSTALSDASRQFVFQVARDASKPEVREPSRSSSRSRSRTSGSPT